MLFTTACGGMFEPPPPLFDSGRYNTIVVLPARVVIKTGSPPFLAENDDLTGKISGLAQEAVSTVMVVKGYDVMAPLDVNDKLRGDRSLEDAFMDVALKSGFMSEMGPPPDDYEMPEGSGRKLAEALGADMIVLVQGNGEFHSFSENLVQGIVPGSFPAVVSPTGTGRWRIPLELWFADEYRQHRGRGAHDIVSDDLAGAAVAHQLAISPQSL